MPYDIFHNYGLDKIHNPMTSEVEYKDSDSNRWRLVATKSVLDSDGFTTDYAWYTDGDEHIFMFGDTDITEPDKDYADWVAESEETAQEWFDTYRGFEEESFNLDEIDDIDENYCGNRDFMNEGFTRVYGDNLTLEE